MVLSQQYRDILIATIPGAFPAPLEFQLLVTAVRQDAWIRIVPLTNTPFASAIALIVDAAASEGWLPALVQRLVARIPGSPELAAVLTEINRATSQGTATDPCHEVLLEGDRPFVNRRELRAHLLDLTNPAGSSVLRVDGEPKTGKTFSFYLINHVARQKGFMVCRFKMGKLPKPDELAIEILGRLGIPKAVPPIGVESSERWAENLAGAVATEIRREKERRLFVFDEFPEANLSADVNLPEGTASFISRLATYADEELRSYLRIVLVRFRADLASDLEDVVLREEVKPFTPTDMTAVVMQVARARNWAVAEAVVADRINQFHLEVPNRPLKERFAFLRELLKQLSGPAS